MCVCVGGGGGVGCALAARICREGLEGEEEFDGMDSEVHHVHKKGRWEGESWVGIFVRVPVESCGFFVTCSVGSLVVRTMDV